MAHPGEIRSLRHAPETGYPPYEAYVAPARFWGDLLGMPEIYRSYSDVIGDGHAGLQDELFDIHKRTVSDSEREKRVLDLYHSLVSAHTDLPHDIALTMSHVTTITYGCVSQFCPEDIRFYIQGKDVRRKRPWQDRKTDIERRLGGWHLEWCPSWNTLDLMGGFVPDRMRSSSGNS